MLHHGARRSIRQPGPPAATRAMAVPVSPVPVAATLPAGMRLLDALAALLAGHGVESACLTLSGGALGPFAYVIPAVSPDGSQAAFYSATLRPGGASRITAAAVTLGLRDGQPFFHCHALWTEADGRPGCGHVLPDETVVAAPIRVEGVGIAGARFEVRPDAETGFSLFMPFADGGAATQGPTRAVAVRLAPNQDLVGALEAVGRAAGFRRAVVHGGVASIIGARFTDAPPVVGFATEMLVRHGDLRCGDEDGPASRLRIAIVDLNGTIGEGDLAVGDNPVLMTFEGVLRSA